MNQICRGLFAWISVAFLSSAIAQPAVTPDLAVMSLDDLGVYSVGYAYRGQPEHLFPLGWSGSFEDQTGVACGPFGVQNGRRAFLLHSPWRNGTGVTFQQFAFALPARASRILLRGATAMRFENVTNSDGATFRLYANGNKLFDYHQTNDTWRPFEFDFTNVRGSNLIVRFEVDPGPKNNPAFDYSFWGNRELVIDGHTPTVASRPAPPALALSNVWSGQTLEVAPSSGFPGVTSVSLSNGVVALRYSGSDGVLEYQWRAPQSANDGLFGALTLNARMTGDTPVTVPLASSAALSWNLPASPLVCGWSQTNMGYTLWRTYSVGSTSATVRITGQLVGKCLALSVTCDQPQITAFDPGTWGPVVRRRQVTAPYYNGAVYHLSQEGLFVNASLDWTASAATSHDGTKAHYQALTDGTRNSLQERALFTAAWHLAEAMPNPPNSPSPWRAFLANKIVLDVWGGSFTNIASNLTRLADYGITNCVAIIHNWQRSGYDNALPSHFPANSSLGGDSGMSHLVATGRRVGIRCAIHENYVDYYPNYDSYDTNDIALDSAGNLQRAWYNAGTRIQSFAVKPNAILRLASTQSPEIHRRYSTDANFLDVHSAVTPWFHVDQRAGETGAGQLSRVWDAHRQLWAYERDTHGGPVFGEGNVHWYWSGCLDGAEAQFGSGWPGSGGFNAPLAVDFDLLKIHPLQFNHGMGYYSRWWPTETYQTNWAGPVPMAVLDRYRLQEVAYGHAGFLDSSVYANIPLAWLEHHLLSPVMAKYATARPVDIRYENNGTWSDGTATAKLDSSEAWNRVQVRYENGLTVTANAGSNAFATGQWLLPDAGWIAHGAGVTAGTTLRNGVVSDFADTGDTLFLNARAARDWNLSSFRRVHPGVGAFQQSGTRAFRVTYRWQVGDLLPKDYSCFVHFDSNGVIRAQQDHPLSSPTSQWQANESISDGPWDVALPANLPDGDYDWFIGLFDPSSDGGRIPLQGVEDGSRRIRLGMLHLASSGTSVRFTAETNSPAFDPTAWYGQHLNNSNTVVDFGDARTDGSVWLRRVGNVWHLKTWPRERNFTLEFNGARFEPPAKVQCTGAASEVAPVQVGAWWRLPLNGASEYRWTNSIATRSSGRKSAQILPGASR